MRGKGCIGDITLLSLVQFTQRALTLRATLSTEAKDGRIAINISAHFLDFNEFYF